MLPSKLLSASRNAFWSTSQSEHKIKEDSADNFLIKDFQGWVLELKKHQLLGHLKMKDLID